MEVYTAVLAETEQALAAQHGLALSEFDVLVNIPREGVRQGELTHRVVLSQSAVSRLVVRLERRGLVTRENDARDSRGVVVHLTAQGRAVLHPAIRTNAEIVERSFADWFTPEELAALDAGFTRLLTARAVAP
ncbi:MarR family transcriptional regulator [Phytoactinopolyspora alkaliphila]|uniref:MarR family transcriptional regulator n=2 Tax=Phytoactinopolyspora alkaliphila TaxID=1783498 RepID=A0A6N9YMY5_9ACTN|nr:MarR family transcriptional regulator [Phytoactinopolyspora alkaliphila]NED96406.1 MarR family transcriptional regulator [Phytoactinopolyspora alkaliphila]